MTDIIMYFLIQWFFQLVFFRSHFFKFQYFKDFFLIYLSSNLFQYFLRAIKTKTYLIARFILTLSLLNTIFFSERNFLLILNYFVLVPTFFSIRFQIFLFQIREPNISSFTLQGFLRVPEIYYFVNLAKNIFN